MTFPTTFANLPGSPATNPASLIDTMFQIVGGMGAIPCTATGTNAITLTPVTNYYLPASYANFQAVAFVAAHSATGAVTIQLGALGFVELFMPSGLQANSGDIIANDFYIAAYNGALNSGSGGFQVFNASTPSVIQPVVGGFKNLKITNGGTPDSQIAVTADQVMLGTSGGGTARVASVSVTISTGTSGANGLDAGSIAQATWYYIFVIYNGSTISGLMSLSATAPTLPAGYTYFARVGAISTGAASTNLTRILQYGRRAQYVVTSATQTPNLPIAATTLTPVGSLTVPTWVSFSVSSYVPPTAGAIYGALWTSGGSNANSAISAMLAPNNQYGAADSQTNPPPCVVSITWFANTTQRLVTPFSFILESSSLYWATVDAGIVSVLGWDDNI